MGHEQPVRADDALHPVRRLRRESLGRSELAPPGWKAPPPAIPAPPPPREPAPTRKHRPRLWLLVGVAILLVGSGTWSALAVPHQSSPGSGDARSSQPALPRQTSAVPAQAPASAVGDLVMFNQSTGWAQRVADGALLHTTQGVLRWTLASPPTSAEIVAVAYVDGRTARALSAPTGPPGPTALQSWSTDDGGASWSAGGSFAVRGFASGLTGGLDFVDAEHGWYSQIENGPGLTGTALFRTVDGGAHWSQVAATGPTGSQWPGGSGVIPTGCDELSATFVNTTTGWITGSCPSGPPPFYRTDDGGVTWGNQDLAAASGSPFSQTSFPPSFSSAEDGTMLTEQVGEAAIATSVYATLDGGEIWSLVYTGAGTPLGSDFVGPGDGWLVLASAYPDAAAPDLYSSRDGGGTWTPVAAFPFMGMNLDFISPQLGWAAPDLSQVGGGPTYLVQTSDGGRSWTGLSPQPAGP